MFSKTSLAIFVAAFLALTARADLWCTGYFPGWEQTAMPASSIDFSALTHIIHFALLPNSNGTLNASANVISPGNSASIVTNTHTAGRKVLICVGGAASQTNFQFATIPANLPTFITNLVDFMSTRGYDGIDLDWEPLYDAYKPQFTNLVIGLRTALNAFSPPKLLTVAAAAYPPYTDPPTAQYAMYASLASQFDQINVMTYDLSGAYSGWVTWYNSPIYDGGNRFTSTGQLVPSIHGAINNFITAGVAASKLGVGIAFYAWVWSGGTGTSTGGAALPLQSWSTPPITSQVSFNSVMSLYYQTNLYQWDTNAQAAYLTINNPGSASDMFISFDDERTCQTKVSYARNQHLGGVMIWELAQDHHSGQPDPLLQAIKQALATPGMTGVQRSDPGVDISFSTLPLGSYRVLWTSNLVVPMWNTLTTTTLSGTGGILHIPDPGVATNSPRFYKIQSPQ